MATKLMITNPAKAKAYFEAKMAFTTGPVELERMMEQGEAINVVDVRAAWPGRVAGLPAYFATVTARRRPRACNNASRLRSSGFPRSDNILYRLSRFSLVLSAN